MFKLHMETLRLSNQVKGTLKIIYKTGEINNAHDRKRAENHTRPSSSPPFLISVTLALWRGGKDWQGHCQEGDRS